MDKLNTLEDKIVLAENIIESADFDKTGLNGNVLVIGGTGAGKTVSYTEPQILYSNNRSLVVSVAKRSLVPYYANYVRSKGYRFEVIDIEKPEKSTIGYDPMIYLKTDTDILDFSKAIIETGSAGEEGRDKYWDNSASQVVSALISMAKEIFSVYKEDHADGILSFSDVIRTNNILEFKEHPGTGTSCSSLDSDFEALKEYNSESFAVKCFQCVKGLALKTASCINSTVKTAMVNAFPPSAVKLMEMENVLDFSSLGKEKTILFVVTSSANESTVKFANLLYAQLFRVLQDVAEDNGGTLDIPVHVICDDFSVSAKIKGFEHYISVFREAGISVSLLIQSITQLTEMYGSSAASTIINNCDRILYLGGMDISTCQNMALRLDLPLSDVLYAPLKTAFVIQRGSKPLKSKRYPTYDDPEYKKAALLPCE